MRFQTTSEELRHLEAPGRRKGEVAVEVHPRDDGASLALPALAAC